MQIFSTEFMRRLAEEVDREEPGLDDDELFNRTLRAYGTPESPLPATRERPDEEER